MTLPQFPLAVLGYLLVAAFFTLIGWLLLVIDPSTTRRSYVWLALIAAFWPVAVLYWIGWAVAFRPGRRIRSP